MQQDKESQQPADKKRIQEKSFFLPQVDSQTTRQQPQSNLHRAEEVSTKTGIWWIDLMAENALKVCLPKQIESNTKSNSLLIFSTQKATRRRRLSSQKQVRTDKTSSESQSKSYQQESQAAEVTGRALASESKSQIAGKSVKESPSKLSAAVQRSSVMKQVLLQQWSKNKHSKHDPQGDCKLYKAIEKQSRQKAEVVVLTQEEIDKVSSDIQELAAKSQDERSDQLNHRLAKLLYQLVTAAEYRYLFSEPGTIEVRGSGTYDLVTSHEASRCPQMYYFGQESKKFLVSDGVCRKQLICEDFYSYQVPLQERKELERCCELLGLTNFSKQFASEKLKEGNTWLIRSIQSVNSHFRQGKDGQVRRAILKRYARHWRHNESQCWIDAWTLRKKKSDFYREIPLFKGRIKVNEIQGVKNSGLGILL